MTEQVSASGPARTARALWTAVVLAAMGIFLAGCESLPLMGGDSKPTVSTAPRQTGSVTPPGQQVPRPPVPVQGQVRVAVLLPFSSPDKATRTMAQSLLDAAQLAMFEMGARSMVLLPQDTGTTPDSAAAAANAAIDKGAELILGPLMAADVRAVGPVARARNVPVIAFSTDRTVAGGGVFLLSFLPEQEVSRIVSFAVSRGHSKFAALIPATAYGKRVEEAFRNSVMQSGREVVSVQTYEPDAQALEPAISAIAKMNFDAIFLPEGGQMLRTIGPVLTVKGVDGRKVKMLGTGLWDEPATAREPSLAGGWYAVPPQEQRIAFITRYQQIYGTKPPRIASLAYDAIALASTLAGGRPGGRYTTGTIGDANGFAGIDGIFRFRPDGMTERGLAVLEVSGMAQPNVASPAATTFQSTGY